MSMSRRGVLLSSAAGAAGILAATTPTAAQAVGRRVLEETKSLPQLHQEALAEGGRVVVYAGGDTPDQQDFTKQAFEAAFPGVTFDVVVDYSKFHDARIDAQLEAGRLVPDVVQLQTLQDFPRWKKAGVLQPYKPAGFSKVHRAFLDPDGAWTGIASLSFSLTHDSRQTGANAPRTAKDLLDPRWKGRIVSTFPNDDDAVLFLYKLAVDRYGWEWLQRLVAQDVTWVRGTQAPGDQVAAGTKAITYGTAAPLVPFPGQTTRFVVPSGDEPFVSYAARAAILRGAARPAAARLYLNWALSLPVQQNSFQWSVRTDVAAPAGLRKVWEYPNANLAGFEGFMADRAGTERFRQRLTLVVGEVTGPPSPGRLGPYPGA